MPVPVERTGWLKAIEIRPGDKRVVHHANILADRLESARHMEQDPGAGFAGMDLNIESESFDPDSHFLFWKPGTVPAPEPDDMSLRILMRITLRLTYKRPRRCRTALRCR
ncbi:MAG: hypothetical protein JO061_22440 [Acidobacteriaceae bacterium]|nr:hypothetical protein [Acidobacteriaceae bacterium]